MSFIGNAPAAIPTSFQAVQADSFNGNGSTTNFTLSRQITNLYDIEVLVDNVQQSPYDGSYSVSGTTLTFSAAPSSGTNNIYVIYRDHPITSIQPKGDLTLEANLNVDGTVYANATLARDGGSDATINGVTPTSDNMMGRNRIINGDMRIDQRNAGASVNTDGAFAVDRFNDRMAGGGVITQQQSTTVPAGFINSLSATVSTNDSSIAASDFYILQHHIEGVNVSDLGFGTANASTVTLSFWVRASIAGTYAGSLLNSAANRSYVYTYTISAADTWEKKSITIAGDTSGTWLTNNGIGLRITWDLGSGSDFQATAGVWGSTYSSRTSGSTNWISTSGATFYITGVQLEAGSVATSFERVDYSEMLRRCQRYYWQTFPSSSTLAINLGTVGTGATKGEYVFIYPVQMRAAASVSVTSISNFSVYVYGPSVAKTGTLLSPSYATNKSVLVRIDYSGATGTVGTAVNLDAFNNDSLKFSAEL